MALRRKNLIRIILLTLILFTVFSSLQIKNAYSSGTINYTFNQDDLFSENTPSPEAGFNTRSQTITTEVFNATESYTGLDSLPASPIAHTEDSDADCESDISDSFNNHTDVLNLTDGSGTGVARVFIELPSARSTNGDVIEFWINHDGTSSERFDMRFYNTGYTKISAYLYKSNTGYLQYTDGGVWNNAQIINSGAWNHIMVKFDWSNDEYDLAVNGFWFLDMDFHDGSDPSDFKRIQLASSTPDVDYSVFVDALDLSWDVGGEWQWYEGRNFLPYEIVLDTVEIDNWEFGTMPDGTLPSQGETDIPFWNVDAGSPSIDIDESHYWDDYAVQMKAESTTHDTISRGFSLEGGKIYSFITLYNGAWDSGGAQAHYYDINYYSYDETLILRLRYMGSVSNVLYYYNGSTYNELYTTSVNLYHRFWIYLYEGYAYVQFKVSSEYYSWTFPLLADKDGLGKVEFDTYASGSDTDCSKFNLDRFTIWQNGDSQADDFGIDYYAFPTSDYFDEVYNEFLVYTLNATGNFSLGLYHYFAQYFLFDGTPFESIDGTFIYQSGFDSAEWMDGYWVKYRTDYVITNISIYSYYALQGSNKYFPIITMSNTNYNESRFYVDTSHRLRFTLIVNDDNSEHIQAFFNIPDLQSENYSISFMSNINGGSLGFFRLNYTDDTSSFVPLPTWMSTTNLILPQTKEIADIGLLITDNDNDDNDVCSGYITNLQLIYIPDITTSIITLNLMMVIVPIIVLLIPTFGIASRYGKNTILPMFILMSIVCVATELIPVWLFFIIAISSGAFLFMKRNRSDI